MGKTLLKEKAKTAEPLLTGTLNERFYRAVHEEPALFYDVVQTGWVDKNLRKENGFTVYDEKSPYEIVLLHGGNVDNKLLTQMMALQDKTAKIKGAAPDNAIDYKSEEEVIGHFSGNGLGLGVFTARGELIGQTMLSFKQPVTGLSDNCDDKSQANIDWLMVDREYGGNNLCQHLIRLAIDIAQSSGMSQVRAHVRLHNERAIAKFAAMGFVIGGTGENTKDGSIHLRAFRPLKEGAVQKEESYPRPLSLNGLREPYGFALFTELVNNGNAAKWDNRAKWFTFHKVEGQRESGPIIVPRAGMSPV